MIPSWVAKYIGLEFEDHGRGPVRFDCWGLVKHILQHEFQLELPDFGSLYSTSTPASHTDRDGLASAFGTGLSDGWKKVEVPQEGDLVIFTRGGKPMHCGLVLAPGCMLHVQPGTGSCVDGYERPAWNRRIEGFYRHLSRS